MPRTSPVDREENERSGGIHPELSFIMSSEAASDRSIGGVLSRSSVYTTLRSLDTANSTRTAEGAASATPTTFSAPPTKKLLQFYSKLSTAHHHRLSERLDGKNTAGRPLSASDVASRLETRALTLTGGGYNSAITSSASSKKQEDGATTTAAAKLSQRQRKHQRRALLRRIGSASSTVAGGTTNGDSNLHFLLQLNAHWNQYMSKLLSLDDKNNTLTSTKDGNRIQSHKVQMMANEIEWIGARVQVNNSTTSSSTKNQPLSGILVSQTERTWRVVPLPLALLSRKNRSKEDDTITRFDNSLPKQMRLPKTRTVPKQKGVSLAVLIPFPREEKEGASLSLRYLQIILQPPSP